LLQEIVNAAPRLSHAVEGVKREHRAITAELDNLSSSVDKVDRHDAIAEVRDIALHALQHIAGHRHRGADLIFEAYSVDIEGGE
jgi:hypothetical protein